MTAECSCACHRRGWFHADGHGMETACSCEYEERRARWRYVTEHMRVATSGCWEWTGSLTNGYGYAWWRSGAYRAHRFAYEVAHGPVDSTLDLDHLCRNRACVNPAHLEPVSRGENLRRGINQWRARTECGNGHPFTEDNTSWRGSRRVCKTCARAYKAAWRERQRGRVA